MYPYVLEISKMRWYDVHRFSPLISLLQIKRDYVPVKVSRMYLRSKSALPSKHDETRSEQNVRLTVLEGLLRTLVATDNEMKGIRKWQLVKEDQRNRQKQCRSKKNADEIEEKLSRPPNQKGQCLTEICLDVPGISEGMMHFLTTKVKGDPVAWFVYIIRESALDAFRFLFCLYNNSFQEKWIKNAGSPYKVLRGWKIGKPRQPDWTRATHSAIFPSKVPHGEWQQPSREKYANVLESV